MARDLTGAMATELQAQRLAPVLLVEALFQSGYVRMWSGRGDLTWNGNTWHGGSGVDVSNPVMVAMSSITESAAVEATGMVLTASSIPVSFLAKVLAECRKSYPVTVWMGAQDLTTEAIIADPTIAFEGRMDVPQISEDGNTCTVAITVENRLIDLQRTRERRYTHEDQQIDHPGDLGFEYVPQLQSDEVVWGAATAKPPSSRGGGPAGPLPGGGAGGRRSL